MYHIRNNEEHSTLKIRYLEKLQVLESSGQFVDCSFVVGSGIETKTFSCHKKVLTAASPVFESMFCGEFEESTNSQNIRLEDVGASEFEKFIFFLHVDNYKCCAPGYLPIELWMKLYFLGDKYLVTNMKGFCFRRIHALITEDYHFFTNNLGLIIKCFEFAYKTQHEELMYITDSAVSKHTDSLKDYFPIFDLDSSIFFKFLSRLDGISTSKRYSLIEIYAKIHHLVPAKFEIIQHEELTELSQHSANTKGTYDSDDLGAMLQTIDFKQMTPVEFCQGPGNSNLFSITEKYEMLEFLVLKYAK